MVVSERWCFEKVFVAHNFSFLTPALALRQWRDTGYSRLQPTARADAYLHTTSNTSEKHLSFPLNTAEQNRWSAFGWVLNAQQLSVAEAYQPGFWWTCSSLTQQHRRNVCIEKPGLFCFITSKQLLRVKLRNLTNCKKHLSPWVFQLSKKKRRIFFKKTRWGISRKSAQNRKKISTLILKYWQCNWQ